jgi:hypothetical protein
LTLNHIYPDYDFTALRAHHFRKLEGLARAEENIDSQLLEVSKVRVGDWGAAGWRSAAQPRGLGLLDVTGPSARCGSSLTMLCLSPPQIRPTSTIGSAAAIPGVGRDARVRGGTIPGEFVVCD